MKRVIGLDLSSSATGICVDGDTCTFEPKGDLHTRCRATATEIGTLVHPDLFCVEAIGTRHVQTAIALSAVHARVIDVMEGTPVLWVAPTQLKKWALGKGAGKGTDKVAMALAAQRSGWDAPAEAGDNDADAWWLWTLGVAWLSFSPVEITAYRREVLDVLRKDQKCAVSA